MPDNSNLPVKKPLLGNAAYDVAKDATTIWLPALATFYATVAIVLNLPFSAEVVGVIGALVILLGTVLKISSNRYQKQPVAYNGQLTVNHSDPMQETHRLEIDQPWNELGKLDEVRIKVVDETRELPADELHANGKD